MSKRKTTKLVSVRDLVLKNIPVKIELLGLEFRRNDQELIDYGPDIDGGEPTNEFDHYLDHTCHFTEGYVVDIWFYGTTVLLSGKESKTYRCGFGCIGEDHIIESHGPTARVAVHRLLKKMRAHYEALGRCAAMFQLPDR